MTQPTEKLTACKDCENYVPPLPASRGGLGHGHRCKAISERGTFNPITGEMTPGGPATCYNINLDGHCPHFTG